MPKKVIKKVVRRRVRVVTKPPSKKPRKITDSKALLNVCGDDVALATFMAEYMKNGKNATKAYTKLHPTVSDLSARVLGARQLTKVNISDVLELYDCGLELYFTQLKNGLEATHPVVNDGEIIEYVDDHKTRRPYHKALGELHGIEGKRDIITNVAVQVNTQVDKDREKYK